MRALPRFRTCWTTPAGAERAMRGIRGWRVAGEDGKIKVSVPFSSTRKR
jgi:hypothetical protein